MSDKYQSQYKTARVSTVFERTKIRETLRKDRRTQHFGNKRNLEPSPKALPKPNDRKAQLLKWKQDKEQKQQKQQLTKKIPFKVCRAPTNIPEKLPIKPAANPYSHVSSRINTNLPIRVTRSTTKKNQITLLPGLLQTKKLAPDNYKFKAPTEVIGQIQQFNKPKPKLIRQTNFDLGLPDICESLSRRSTIFTIENDNKTAHEISPMLKRLSIMPSSSTQITVIDLTESPDVAAKPTSQSTPLDKNVKDARYFENLLDSEVSRLLSECDVWTSNMQDETLAVPENVRDEIDSVIGQARLLVSKKFEQFRGLIYNCAQDDGDMKVTCEDLQGFWDMVYIQVGNIDKRFAKLQELKQKQWVEDKVQIISTRQKIQVTKSKKAISSSGIQAFIQAARKAKLTKTVETTSTDVIEEKKITPKPVRPKPSFRLRNVIKATQEKKLIEKSGIEEEETATNKFEGGFFSIVSPIKKYVSPVKPKPIENIQNSIFTKNRRVSSPGLAMMRVSMVAKIAENGNLRYDTPSRPSTGTLLALTPARSILKTPKAEGRSCVKKKVVLFSSDEDEENRENTPPQQNEECDLISWETPARRRSARISTNLAKQMK